MSATLPQEVLEMTNKFMTDPIRVLVKRDELTLEVREAHREQCGSVQHSAAATTRGAATWGAATAPVVLNSHVERALSRAQEAVFRALPGTGYKGSSQAAAAMCLGSMEYGVSACSVRRRNLTFFSCPAANPSHFAGHQAVLCGSGA